MTLDCRGQRCPLPVIALARNIQNVAVGEVVRVLADDPAAANDIPAWCRLKAHDYLGSPFPAAFDIRRRPSPARSDDHEAVAARPRHTQPPSSRSTK